MACFCYSLISEGVCAVGLLKENRKKSSDGTENPIKSGCRIGEIRCRSDRIGKDGRILGAQFHRGRTYPLVSEFFALSCQPVLTRLRINSFWFSLILPNAMASITLNARDTRSFIFCCPRI